MFRLIYSHHQADRKNKNLYLYFCDQRDNGYILAETCGWVYVMNKSCV